MFGIRYTHVRSVLALIALAILTAALFVARDTVTAFLLIVLLVATAMSWINPPGIYGWLFKAICPYCHGHVVWEMQQSPEPYHEVIVARCEDCGRSKVEFAYRPR
jgi:hypothetical protein